MAVATTIADRLYFLNSATIKAPCRVATTVNIAVTGLQTVDGVALVVGDRVLVAQQTDTAENGIYVAGPDNWPRAIDLTKPADVLEGTMVLVVEGTVNAGNLFKLEPL
jgi:hypothetical protein